MAMASSTNRSTVVGVFHDHQAADRAVSDLRQAGFRDDQIGVAGRHPEGSWKGEEASGEESHAGTGALTGVLAGAGLGGLVGLGVLAGIIPAIGPVIAGGTLAALLANAAGGAAIGGLAGALIGAGIPAEEAEYYHGEFEAGRTIVTVRADGRHDEAEAILRRHGAYDMKTRDTAAHATAEKIHATTGGQAIPVREEELQAHKHQVEAGEVTVRKDVVTEHKTMDVPVQHEEVIVERHAPSGQYTASSADIASGHQEIRVPVMEEQVSVEKHPVVKEEVTVGKKIVQDTEKVGGEVRKEEVHVERQGDVHVRDEGTGKH